MPERPRARWVLARASRGPGEPGPSDADSLTTVWKRTRKDVRALHEKIFLPPAAVHHGGPVRRGGPPHPGGGG